MKKILVGGLAVSLFLGAWARPALPGEGSGLTGLETVRDAERRRREADLQQARAEESDRGRKVFFTLFTGAQYDDNITLRSLGVETEGDDRTDWKLIHAFSMDYRAVNTADDVAGLRYNLYQSLVDINDDVQLTGNTLTGYYTGSRPPRLFHVPFSFSRYNLFWHRYLDVYEFAPKLFVEQSPHAVGVLHAGYARNNFYHVPDNDFDENERDSDVFSVGWEEWFLFGKDAEYRLETGYVFRKEIARAEEWGSFSHKVRVSLGAQLPWGNISAGTFTAYEAKDYAKRNPDFGKIQEDDILTVGLSLSRPLWRNATLSMSYLFTDNESNVVSQDFERNQVTLGLTVRF